MDNPKAISGIIDEQVDTSVALQEDAPMPSATNIIATEDTIIPEAVQQPNDAVDGAIDEAVTEEAVTKETVTQQNFAEEAVESEATVSEAVQNDVMLKDSMPMQITVSDTAGKPIVEPRIVVTAGHNIAKEPTIIVTNEQTVVEEQPQKAAVSKKTFVSKATVSSLSETSKGFFSANNHVLLLCLISLFLCFSFFMPIVNVSTAFNEKSSYDVSFSPLDFVSYGISAFYQETERTLTSTEEYKAHEKIMRSLRNLDPDRRLTERQKSLMSDYAKSSIRISLMYENNTPKLNHVVVIVLSIVGLCSSAICAISTLALWVQLQRNTQNNYNQKIKKANQRISALLVFTPLFLMLMLQASNFSNSIAGSGFGNAGTSLTWCGIGMIAIVLFAVVRFLSKAKSLIAVKGTSHINYGLLMKVLAMCCLVFAVCAMFLPFVNVQLASYNGRRIITDKLSVAPKYFFEMSAGDHTYYTALSETAEESFIATLDNALSGKDIGFHFGHYICTWIGSRFTYGMDGIYTSISAITLFSILVLSMFTLSMGRLIFNKKSIKHPHRLMFLSIGLTIAYLIASAFLVITYNSNMSISLSKYALFSVGVGPILSVVLTIFAIILLNIRIREEAPRQYDNPDVSSNPYVL
ncbi:MAG: hypothetical protein J6Q57_00060 [Paraprevotella sp.]|nr:hypothetical protein [Paraprevotella sp.]